MLIKAQVYEQKILPVFHAVLWQGRAADLVGMPEFNELVSRITKISPGGMLHIRLDDDVIYDNIKPGEFYIVHSSVNGFYALTRKEFENNFRLAPEKGDDGWPI